MNLKKNDLPNNRLIFKGSLDYPHLYSIGDKSSSCDANYFNFIHNVRDNLKSGRKETIKIIANVTLWLTPPGSITAIPVTNLETLV